MEFTITPRSGDRRPITFFWSTYYIFADDTGKRPGTLGSQLTAPSRNGGRSTIGIDYDMRTTVDENRRRFERVCRRWYRAMRRRYETNLTSY